MKADRGKLDAATLKWAARYCRAEQRRLERAATETPSPLYRTMYEARSDTAYCIADYLLDAARQSKPAPRKRKARNG